MRLDTFTLPCPKCHAQVELKVEFIEVTHERGSVSVEIKAANHRHICEVRSDG